METIKEEKKAELEQLLNNLIEKGWKPFGIACTDFIKGTGLEGIPSYCFNPHPHMGFPGGTRRYHRPSLRQIVSKESGLWQFVCENGMVDVKDNRYDFFEYYKGMDEEGAFRDAQRYDESYEYRIMQSALKDENELEDFLLNSIKLD